MRAVLSFLVAALAFAAGPVQGLSTQPWRLARSAASPSLSPSPPSSLSPLAPAPIAGSIPPFQPIANPAAIVTAGNARFTVLTDRLIRLEWSATRTFQEQATWVAIQRNHTVPAFKTSSNSTHTLISTPYVTVEYLTASTTTFNSSNIRVTATYTTVSPSTLQLTVNSVSWQAINKEEVAGNLFGTFRTLDGDTTDETNQLDCATSGRSDQHCTYGVISRNGYALIDDTHTPAFDNSPWPWITPRQWPAPPGDQCMLADADKRDCGFIGITGEQCQQTGCCWNSGDAAGIPSCFYGQQADQDLYFLGHGHDYKGAMTDFTALSGDIPLPPRYTFGVFFSRYWAYASYEEKQIVRDYVQHDIPLDVLVIDMDWHITFYKQANRGVRDQAGEQIGWSGFTFDPHLFVNHTQFLVWCKTLGLRNTLNVHPASGIQPWEETYEVMARAMGIDPASGRYVPFNETDKKFITNWFRYTMRPLEEAGIDLWWLDWQQGEDFVHGIPGFNPTFQLNYEFFTDPEHWDVNGKRNALLHRWGGLGNHRYQIGFSGDVTPNWDTLTFQPVFTATAANVGYTFWSHDLGGHTQPTEPELYTRWLQWGAFSPVFRTHCTKDVANDRRIYTYPWAYYSTLRQFTKLRQSLTPYIYTSARHTHDLARALVQPLYYEYPEFDEAYIYNHTYLYGSSFFLAPVTRPLSPATAMTPWTFWLPPGRWVNFFTGDVLEGPKVLSGNWTLWEVPAYAREGSIIPLLPDSTPPLSQAQVSPPVLKLVAMVGSGMNGSGEVYDDEGDNNGYRTGEYAWTRFVYEIDASGLTFTVVPAVGKYPQQLPARAYELHLRGVMPPSSVQVGGQEVVYEQYNDIDLSMAGKMQREVDTWAYDGATLSVVIQLRRPRSVQEAVEVKAAYSTSVSQSALQGLQGTIARFVSAKALLDSQWGTAHTVFQDDYPSLLDMASVGERLTYDPRSVGAVVKGLAGMRMAACEEINRNITNLLPEVRQQLAAQLC